MINLAPISKRLLFSAMVILLFGFFTFNTQAQESKIDFKYSIDSLKVGEIFQYTVSVTVKSGEGPFMIGVYENLKEDLKEFNS